MDSYNLKLKWDIVNNIAGVGSDKYFFSDLTISNVGSATIKNSGWKLYFNFIRLIYSDGEDKKNFDNAGVKIKKFSGSLYCLEPLDNWKELLPGDSLVIRFKSSDWAILKGDSIMGAHIQFDNSTNAKALDVEVGEFVSEEQTKRYFGDNLSVETPEIRYNDNLKTTISSSLPLDRAIIPRPEEYTNKKGHIQLNRIKNINVCDEQSYLISILDLDFSYNNCIKKQENDSLIIRISDYLDYNSYIIDSDSSQNSLVLEGGSDSALFYGLMTIKQIFNYSKDEVECFRISDRPRFNYRGLMLDIARHFQSKETIFKILDLMAHFKLNKLHLHFCDDEGWRIENKKLPELTEYGSRRGFDPEENVMLNIVFGSGSGPELADDNICDKDKVEKSFYNFVGEGSGYYTEDDFVEILKYANDRFIEIIPEIDVPGHCRAAIKSMEYRYKNTGDFKLRLVEPEDTSEYLSVQLYTDNVINPCLESTYYFLEEVTKGLSYLYKRAGIKLKMLHLGGDEVPLGVWEKSPICKKYMVNNGITDPRELIDVFYNRFIGIVENVCGATVSGWDDIVIHKNEIKEELKDKGFTSLSWSNVHGWGGEANAYRLANSGFNIILASATNLYLDLAYCKDSNEVGYYWAGFVDTKKTFYYRPFDFYKSMLSDRMGNKIDQNDFKNMEHLKKESESRVLGLQGLLWGENSKTPDILEYQMFPKLLGVAERAWNINMPEIDTIDKEWSFFASTLGLYMLPYLDKLYVNYRIPQPGGIVRDNQLLMNSRFPGLLLEYSLDNGRTWQRYNSDEKLKISGKVLIRSSNSCGTRFSRISELIDY